MGFDRLLGNEQLKQNLQGNLRQGRISHFYLITGPAGSGKRTLAGLLAAAAVCQGADKPCGQCSGCRKAFSGIHPDLITVDEPEKKTVSVELIRRTLRDVAMQPNEAPRKVYVFPRAQEITVPGQNALLKALEEPPAYGVFLLLADNPDRLLPTVRSRCRELTMRALPEPLLRRALREQFPQAGDEALDAAIFRSGGYLGQAKEFLESGGTAPPQTLAFVESYAQRDSLGLLQTLAPMERWKREQLLPILRQWEQLLQSALSYRCAGPAPAPSARKISASRSSPELIQSLQCLRTACSYLESNVSTAAVCGYLAWALR